MSLSAEVTVRDGVSWLRVSQHQWRAAHVQAREAGYSRCEWLTAVDSGDMTVVCHVSGAAGLLVLSTVAVNDECPSIDDIYVSASFHEREVAQMFGIAFLGASDTQPAFDADFGGHPLRRTYALQPRVAHTWPGADDASARRPTPVPGVNAEWSL